MRRAAGQPRCGGVGTGTASQANERSQAGRAQAPRIAVGGQRIHKHKAVLHRKRGAA